MELLARPSPRYARDVEPRFAKDDIKALNRRMEDEHPREVVRWALEDSGLERVALASAFQAEGTAVMHMASQIRPGVTVLFLDTGFHFKETLRHKNRVAELLDIEVVDLRGTYTPGTQAAEFGELLYEADPERCCDINKVQPMLAALRGLDCWVTAYRRDSSPTRATAPMIDQYELEPGSWMVKVNPMATWQRRDTWRYLKEHDLPHNPLYDIGYSSIGCAPCSRMQFMGESEREGRWAGLSKWECGIQQIGDPR